MIDANTVKHDALDTMWAFLQMGGQKANILMLRKLCAELQQMMLQKTAGQRKDKPRDISFGDLERICNGIVIEAMALYLSGALDKWEDDGQR